MKKELKEYIKQHKLSDDDILKLLQSQSPSETDESDVKDEDESEEQTDSEESDTAEKTSAKEKPKKDLKISDLEAMIKKAIAEQLKASESEKKLPAQLPIKKSEPKPKTPPADFIVGGFNLIT